MERHQMMPLFPCGSSSSSWNFLIFWLSSASHYLVTPVYLHSIKTKIETTRPADRPRQWVTVGRAPGELEVGATPESFPFLWPFPSLPTALGIKLGGLTHGRPVIDHRATPQPFDSLRRHIELNNSCLWGHRLPHAFLIRPLFVICTCWNLSSGRQRHLYMLPWRKLWNLTTLGLIPPTPPHALASHVARF